MPPPPPVFEYVAVIIAFADGIVADVEAAAALAKMMYRPPTGELLAAGGRVALTFTIVPAV